MKSINCILLIDDNPADNRFHEIRIKESGLCKHVSKVSSGIEALDYIMRSADDSHSGAFPKPDIIFLDINMPGMNGFEFLEKYAKLDEKLKSKVVIVMLTNSLNPDDKKRAMDTKQVSEFQNKPLTVKMLQDMVEKYF